jgi:hypothetical protein
MSSSSLKSFARNSILLSFAVFNLGLFINTGYRLKAVSSPREFGMTLAISRQWAYILILDWYEDYLDDDRPVHMPVTDIPLAEMTFHEVSQFSLDATPTHKGNWQTLYTNQFGIGFQHLGPFHWRYISEEYHGLHCLYTMQRDFDTPDHANHPSGHLIHCIFYLRQLFLCNADMTLEEGDILQRNFTMDRIGETRVCRDWDHIAKWVNDDFDGWLKQNNVSSSEVPQPTQFNTEG